MKLIIVDRSKPQTYARLKEAFADDINVEVVWERRTRERRQKRGALTPERRAAERRRWSKAWNGRDYIVIHIANGKS